MQYIVFFMYSKQNSQQMAKSYVLKDFILRQEAINIQTYMHTVSNGPGYVSIMVFSQEKNISDTDKRNN